MLIFYSYWLIIRIVEILDDNLSSWLLDIYVIIVGDNLLFIWYVYTYVIL